MSLFLPTILSPWKREEGTRRAADPSAINLLPYEAHLSHRTLHKYRVRVLRKTGTPQTLGRTIYEGFKEGILSPRV